jgi:hypothetical protein
LRFHDKAAAVIAQARLVHLHVLAIGSGLLDVAAFLLLFNALNIFALNCSI